MRDETGVKNNLGKKVCLAIHTSLLIFFPLKLTDCHAVPLASFDGFRLSITMWPQQLHYMFEKMSC